MPPDPLEILFSGVVKYNRTVGKLFKLEVLIKSNAAPNAVFCLLPAERLTSVEGMGQVKAAAIFYVYIIIVEFCGKHIYHQVYYTLKSK